MADDEEPRPDPIEPSPEGARVEPVDARPSFVRRHWGKLLVAAVILVPALVFTIWAGIALSYSYSDGNRVGYVQKLSRKGWLCKTWEGELQISNIPGSAPILFQFSVRSDSVARAIEALAGRQVQIHYQQHVGVPSNCFGETEYFVDAVRAVQP
jgi:hypothetical protein